MVWNFSNDCRKVRVAVAEHDPLHEQFLSRNRAMSRFYRDWIAIARQYCPCIGSSNQMIVMLLFRIALNLCTNMAAKLSKYCGRRLWNALFLITFLHANACSSYNQWQKVFGQWYNIYRHICAFPNTVQHKTTIPPSPTLNNVGWLARNILRRYFHTQHWTVRGVDCVVNVRSFAILSKVFCHWLSETLF